MNDEQQVKELKAWMQMYLDKTFREGSPSIHRATLMARADGMVNTSLITWEKWRELELLADGLYELSIVGRVPPKADLDDD